MIVVVSRFRVANGQEAEVRRAFSERPRRVDRVPGFLGIEVFTSADDPATFHLVTRWVDEACYRSWHSSPEHKASHQLIPEGLKLEGEHTEVRVLERIEDEPGEKAAYERIAADEAPLLAALLARGQNLHLARAARTDGTLLEVNRAFARSLGAEPRDLVGRPVYQVMTETSATTLRDSVARTRREVDETMKLHMVDRRENPTTLECHVDLDEKSFLLVGEPVRDSELALRDTLIKLQGELAVATREQARQVRELAEAKRDLEESHWHLKKISEVLPICMACGKIKAGADWKPLVEYFNQHSDFLSHGYCPTCTRELMKVIE